MEPFRHAAIPRAGALLVARPELGDPNFRRTVVHLASHDTEGTLGFILNRPTGQTLADLVTNRPELEPFADVPVFFGGPVAPGQLLLAALEWTEAGGLAFRHALTPEEIAALRQTGRVSVRGFIGYAGWGKGQLDAELREHSWLVLPAERWVLDPAACREAWPRLLRNLGPWFRLMSGLPEDPSLN